MLHTLILAAGLGTRLRPLTQRIAKPLIPIIDNSPLGRQVALAKKLGAEKIHANAHHLAEQVQNAAEELGIHKVWKEEELLGTGGPICRMHFEGERGELLVLNGDCEHNLDVELFLKEARNSGASCALLAVENEKVNTLCIDENNMLCGIKNRFGKAGDSRATFTGISWYSQSAWEKIKEKDIRDFWEKEPPFIFKISGDWIDIGSPQGLMEGVELRMDSPLIEGCPELAEGRGVRRRREGSQGSFSIAGEAGSGRKYYRMQANGHSLILQQSHDEDKDFERFVRYGKLFCENGLPTPEIYAVDEKRRRVVMQDLGAVRLCDAKNPMIYYPLVLEKLIVWQEASGKIFEKDEELKNRIFGEKDYLWESEYYAENFLPIAESGWAQHFAPIQPQQLAKKATAHLRVLMHRDFQSQNVMLNNGNISFIDFQGARNGSIYYDAASLLWDPYMMLPAESVKHLFTLFYNANPLLKGVSFEDAWEDFLVASTQRLMQALGAYCFLSRKKGIKAFEQYIEPGTRRLGEVVQSLYITGYSP